jgi:hypothetical protein
MQHVSQYNQKKCSIRHLLILQLHILTEWQFCSSFLYIFAWINEPTNISASVYLYSAKLYALCALWYVIEYCLLVSSVMCCGEVWCGVMWCVVKWYDVMCCDVVWSGMMWCVVMWCDVMWEVLHLLKCSLERSDATRYSGVLWMLHNRRYERADRLCSRNVTLPLPH